MKKCCETCAYWQTDQPRPTTGECCATHGGRVTKSKPMGVTMRLYVWGIPKSAYLETHKSFCCAAWKRDAVNLGKAAR